ncbi:hypothetical protein TRVA0_025S00914 [Trichomonascus vanleenenianus]|uniref:uncharacterized protein n=1 Tax=Trichomonascus vanleenenianus TaxID=2268995 RepID=UPI003ECB1587
MGEPKIAIIYYSLKGHIRIIAEHLQQSIEAAGGRADLYQVEETLPTEVLQKMHAEEKAKYPIATPETLTQYDGFILGVPTRFGNMPAQWKAFWDKTGGLWMQGALTGKYAGFFTSTGTPNAGAEATVMNFLSTMTHHGILFVPLGYQARPQMSNLEEVHGGSPWGSGTFASPDGSRMPTKMELEIAATQGQAFYKTLKKVSF